MGDLVRRLRDAWAVLRGRAVVTRELPSPRFRVGYFGESGSHARKCWELLSASDLAGEFRFYDRAACRGELTR